eukprot:scaffold70853_cov66-Phaeocystis_antarctica.AAC.2
MLPNPSRPPEKTVVATSGILNVAMQSHLRSPFSAAQVSPATKAAPATQRRRAAQRIAPQVLPAKALSCKHANTQT